MLAGLLLLVGVLFLLYKRVVFIDRHTERAVEFELPVLGRIRTQSPVLALAAFGVAMVTYPVYLSTRGQQSIELSGSLDTGGRSAEILVVAMPSYQTSIHKPVGEQSFSLPIPLLPNTTYRVRVFVDEILVADAPTKMEAGALKVPPIVWKPQASR
jgi:hypothetical protein